MTDPAEIDLEATKRWIADPRSGFVPYYVESLIAAVEALRVQVICLDNESELRFARMEFEGNRHAEVCVERDDWKTKAKAAQAREVELAGVIMTIVGNAEMIPDPNMEGIADCFLVPLDDISEARTVLASTPAEALERATAKDEVVNACRKSKRLIESGQVLTAVTRCDEALANLDALNKEPPP